MKNTAIVCHLTSVHPRTDARIFLKECSSLAAYGFDVRLVTADGLIDENISSVKIISACKKINNRFFRMILSSLLVLKKALQIKAEIYHFHDPELIPAGYFLKIIGKKVIYDVHEDVPRQIYVKPWLNIFFKRIISFLFEKFENFTASKFDYIFCATEHIKNRFSEFNKNAIALFNYPLLKDAERVKSVKSNSISYIGNISEDRGIIEILDAVSNLNVELVLAGRIVSRKLELILIKHPGWRKVKYYGFVDKQKVKEILSRSLIGLVILHPMENHVVGMPVKMFEYMAAGIPVIASDFPLWGDIIRKYKCGLTVNPLKASDISSAIKFLTCNKSLSIKMGNNGRKAVIRELNWKSEEKKMLHVYDTIVKKYN